MTAQFGHEPGDGHLCMRVGEHCALCGSRLVPAYDPADRAYVPLAAAAALATDGTEAADDV
ncbi:hypothetical protein [Streptomyces sp. NPDC001404]|uniref:hypothetical protein n=1 Tax=Streptomyces sp. NPDC001404 TaxID=3364571 RepID=UPI00368D9D42